MGKNIITLFPNKKAQEEYQASQQDRESQPKLGKFAANFKKSSEHGSFVEGLEEPSGSKDTLSPS